MRRRGTTLRLCGKCGGELRPPRRAVTIAEDTPPATAPDLGVFTCIVCGDSVMLPARRKQDLRQTLPE